MIRHFVHVHFADQTTEDERQAVEADLRALLDVVPGALSFEWRDNISPEDPVVRGFRHVFWFDFADAAARDGYLVHPEHRAAGARLVAAAAGGADGIFVCDIAL